MIRAASVMRALHRVASRAMLLVVACWLVLAGTAHGQRAIDWTTRPVLLMTMGQGDEVFEKFGHNAIVVWDEGTGQPIAYNWGMFDFAQPNFIGRFLTGDTKYWMEPFVMDRMVGLYERLNRTVTVQELRLTPSQKTRLVSMLAENAKEANKYYRYDYYRDNCSTRARDAIDVVTGGALKRAMQAQPGQGSYRWHTRRLLAYSTPLYFGSELVLGVDADAPLTGWQEAFLPQSLSESVKRIELPAAEGLPDRLLAGPVDTLFSARRPPEPPDASWRVASAAVIGVIIGLALLGLSRLGRIASAVGIILWSLVIGAFGVVLLLAWLATRHDFMANNPSVALVNPAWVLAIVAAIMILRGGVSRGVRSGLRWLLVIAVLGTAGAVMLGHGGSALEIAALVLPAHAAVAYAADRYRRTVGH